MKKGIVCALVAVDLTKGTQPAEKRVIVSGSLVTKGNLDSFIK